MPILLATNVAGVLEAHVNANAARTVLFWSSFSMKNLNGRQTFAHGPLPSSEVARS